MHIGRFYKENVSAEVLAFFRRRSLACNNVRDVFDLLTPPTFRHAVRAARVFVAGKAEADEPFAEDEPCGFFQQSDALQVVLNQVVIGGKNGGDFALGRGRREQEFVVFNLLPANVRQ